MKSTKAAGDLLTRGVHQITVAKHLEASLAKGEKLRIKHGVDPTTADLHLGYAVVYRKLRAFQELGHTIVFLIGDFTARFGDPTDKEKTRVMRTKDEVEAAAKSYIDQIGLMLDVSKLEIRRNGEWYDNMSAEQLLRIMSEFTVARMLERDMFEKRMKQGKEIGLHEPVYPVLQAYDSVMLKSDCTVIGTDQTFNELQARILQERNGQEPQDVMSLDILVGTDGVQKMSQSLGNSIPLKAEPADMFGKIMSIPDAALEQYLVLLTDVPLDEVKRIARDKKKIMDNKKMLARLIVEQFHSKDAAEKAEEQFEKVIQHKGVPNEIETFEIPAKNFTSITAVSAQMFGLSKSEIQRLIQQGAISRDGVVIKDPFEKPKEGVYKKGKRHYKKLKKK